MCSASLLPSLHVVLPCPQELQQLLAKFHWYPGHNFTTTVDLANLKGALQKYKYIKIGQLGSGSYGVVHKAINRETNELLAIKKVVHSIENGLSDSTIREISTLRELQHDNIVRCVAPRETAEALGMPLAVRRMLERQWHARRAAGDCIGRILLLW